MSALQHEYVRNARSAADFELHGRVLPAPGESQLPPQVWVVLRASGSRGFKEKQLVGGHGEFKFFGIPPGDYELSVESEGYETDRVEISEWSFRGSPQGILLTLGRRRLVSSRLGSPATVHLDTLRIPKRALLEMGKAANASDAGDLEKAVRHLRKAIKAYPDFSEAFNNLGAIQIRMRRFWEAQAALQQAVRLKPDSGIIWKNLGFCYLMMQQWDLAVESLGKATARAPSDARSHAYLGEAYYRLERYPEAAAALRKALQLNPDFYEASHLLGYSYLQLKQYPEALGAFERFLQTNRGIDSSRAEEWVAKIREKLGH